MQKVEKKNNDIKAFSMEEQEKVLKHLNLNNIVDCVIFFNFYTGLHLGEVLGVKWENIKENMIDIGRVVKNGLTYEFRKLKTVNGLRTIPLPTKVLNMLEKIPKDAELTFHINGQGLDLKEE